MLLKQRTFQFAMLKHQRRNNNGSNTKAQVIAKMVLKVLMVENDLLEKSITESRPDVFLVFLGMTLTNRV